MTMGLQDLMMFRDNLQQPAPTGMDNLRNLQALTMQGMTAEDYINEPQPMMMNTGLMSLPVAQAGFGGFIKKITSIPRAIAKGVKRFAKSDIGRLAIAAAPMVFGLPPIVANPALNAAIYSGGTTLLTGGKPKDALKSAVISGGLTGLTQGFSTPKGSKGLFSSGQATQAGTGGASSAYTGGPTDTTGLSYGQAYSQPTMVGDVAAQQAAGVGVTPGLTGIDTAASGIGPEALSYQAAAGPSTPAFTGQEFGGGDVFTPAGREAALTGIDTASAPQMTTYGGDVGTMQYPGGTVPTVSAPSLLDKTKDALMKGVQFAKDRPITTALGAATLLSGLGAGQQIPQQQLAMAGLTPVETDFDKQVFTYRDREGNILTRDEALRMIQQASQSVEAGGQKQASGVTYGFDRVDDNFQGASPEQLAQTIGQSVFSKSGGMVDPVLSASGGLIGMMYGGQAMPENNMDVKYKEFSGMVGGRGDGMEDNVYMPIVEGERGQQVATLAVSPKEYVVDANTMSLLGNGNPDEGAEIMDQTVKDIRKKATGQTKQQKEIDGLAALNRMRRSVS
jgi:hypothetical protein